MSRTYVQPTTDGRRVTVQVRPSKGVKVAPKIAALAPFRRLQRVEAETREAVRAAGGWNGYFALRETRSRRDILASLTEPGDV